MAKKNAKKNAPAITLKYNAELDGLEIRFAEKPKSTESLKKAGFRFTNWNADHTERNDARWWHKYDDEALAFACELCGYDADMTENAKEALEEKRAGKAEAPKAKKTKAKKTAPEAKKTAPKAKKTAAKKSEGFTHGNRGDSKERYEIRMKDGSTQNVKGFVFANTLAGTTVKFGTHKTVKNGEEVWTLTELSTGIAVGQFPKCYIAIASADEALTAKVIDKMGL